MGDGMKKAISVGVVSLALGVIFLVCKLFGVIGGTVDLFPGLMDARLLTEVLAILLPVILYVSVATNDVNLSQIHIVDLIYRLVVVVLWIVMTVFMSQETGRR